jgi:hypothetical protein
MLGTVAELYASMCIHKIYILLFGMLVCVLLLHRASRLAALIYSSAYTSVVTLVATRITVCVADNDLDGKPA